MIARTSDSAMQQRLSGGVLVEHEGRVLLVRSVRSGKCDFWVAPGGGVQGSEELTAAARREVKEETGLEVDVIRLLYIEELLQPTLRICKFWYIGKLRGGTLSVQHQMRPLSTSPKRLGCLATKSKPRQCFHLKARTRCRPSTACAQQHDLISRAAEAARLVHSRPVALPETACLLPASTEGL